MKKEIYEALSAGLREIKKINENNFINNPDKTLKNLYEKEKVGIKKAFKWLEENSK